MKTIMDALTRNVGITDYKINQNRTESYQLFFVKGKLETVRCTDNCDTEVTVYAAHGDFLGHAQFFVYPSTGSVDLEGKIAEAVEKALLMDNPAYSLPGAETGEYAVPSNFSDYDMADLAATVANTVQSVVGSEGTSLNAVEVFLYHHQETVRNSRGLHKTQSRYSAMVEAIPTCTRDGESVELYEQYNFSDLDEKTLTGEIAEKLRQVDARYRAKKLAVERVEKVILNAQELKEFCWALADDLDYASVYGHHNVYKKGDAIQSAPVGDSIRISLHGRLPGSPSSRAFDADGLNLGEKIIVENGKAVSYWGSNRFGQYLDEEPTGSLPCLHLAPGTAEEGDFTEGPYLEVVSMSGLQTDFYSDYLGGEIRLAYYHNGKSVIPVTGISISGKLSEVLNTVRFSREEITQGSYRGPKKAIVRKMNIF